MLEWQIYFLGQPQIPGVHEGVEAKLRILKLTTVIHHLPSVGLKQLWMLEHLGYTHEAGTSYLSYQIASNISRLSPKPEIEFQR